MPGSPVSAPRRAPLRLAFATLALVALAGLGAIELRASQAAGQAVRDLQARMAGAGESDASSLPSRTEIETLLHRQPATPPQHAPDGTQKAVYRWQGLFRSYEVKAFYTSGTVPRLVRYESPDANAKTP